jgi:cytochrome c
LDGVWTPARLDVWLSGTQKMAPGSKMYLALDDAEERHLIIAYLKSISRPGGSK